MEVVRHLDAITGERSDHTICLLVNAAIVFWRGNVSWLYSKHVCSHLISEAICTGNSMTHTTGQTVIIYGRFPFPRLCGHTPTRCTLRTQCVTCMYIYVYIGSLVLYGVAIMQTICASWCTQVLETHETN
uniref:Uncharacterized protein n=1 Tax=Trypanosoma vivax (strain Y486) TaxID=1055687 RepID=G0TZB5_TRYVY|nr:hypothetical protein, unlikely [Trypanosoma vivax Y486]